MNRSRQVVMMFVLGAGVAFLGAGCQSNGEAAGATSMPAEHAEHPQGEHPQGDHPKGDHPQGDHPNK